VNSAIILASGASVSAVNFLFGRYLATLTPEKAAEMKRHNPGLESLVALHRFGKVIMVCTPFLFGGFAYLAFNGTAG
jgi:hypothetical protein